MLIFTTIKEIPEFPCLVGRQGCASSAKGGRWWSETSSFLRMQESLPSFVVSKRTSMFFLTFIGGNTLYLFQEII